MTEPALKAPRSNGEAPKSNVEAVYQRLRQEILDGKLEAGLRLSQPQLAAKYDMSRGPLREALRLLERDGLVETEHQRMVHVSQVSVPDLDELYALRIVNESLAVRLAVPKMSEADFERLRSRLDEMNAASAEAAWDRWQTAHREFHTALWSPAGERTVDMLSELFDHADRYRRIYHPRGHEAAVTAGEHLEILEACADRDAEDAGLRVARHLTHAALNLCAHANPEYEPSRVRTAWRFVKGPGESSSPG